ncbi:MAG: glucose-6-phosphate dehydrogenase assembly protein OpcA [Acidobacteriia bacterium]|nr:glucose-6-phosphate dehydrogenase assembly protein OpcA [Terriglobia bacterium]
MGAVAIHPEKVLRDLRELWAELGRDQESAGGVLRACSMTLLVLAEDETDAEGVRRTLGVLMHHHPSRAIVLRAVEGALLDARVFAECWMPFGSNQQICSEGIELSADASNLGDVARLMVPLMVPDLPVVLWARGPRFFSSRYFDPLFPLADKIIVDSTTAPNARGAIAVLKEMRSRGRRIADLAWTRLTPWRETLAHVFEDCPDKPRQVRDVDIQYGGALTSTIVYFSRWIERAIPSARVALEAIPGEPGIRSVNLTGEKLNLSVNAAGGSLEVCSGAAVAMSMLPSLDHDALMNEELSVVGPDAAFEKVLAD